MLSQLNLHARVYSIDQKYLGRLTYLVVSQDNDKLSKFVIKKGIFQNDQKIINIKFVETISRDGRTIKLKITCREFENLPSLTIYEEEKPFYDRPNKPAPFKLHTRLVTYLPDSAFSADEIADINDEEHLTGRFMKRIKIYTDQFILLGGKSIFRVANRGVTGILHKIKFNLPSGQIESLNLRKGLLFIPFAEFQVPFKLSTINRMDKAAL
jgi:hypothetical protein